MRMMMSDLTPDQEYALAKIGNTKHLDELVKSSDNWTRYLIAKCGDAEHLKKLSKNTLKGIRIRAKDSIKNKYR